MTFADAVKLDSRIGDLLKEAQAVKRIEGKSFCANEIWYGYNGRSREDGLRYKVQLLVGHARQDGPAELKTSKAYDVVYEMIYNALPDCKDCLFCA